MREGRPESAGEQLLRAIERYALYSLGKPWEELSGFDRFKAVSLATRERLVEGLVDTEERVRRQSAKRCYYLSMEFLLGRLLGNNLLNLGLLQAGSHALRALGGELEEILDEEPDAALGNGGLGRLAACFLDSLATLGIPGDGYGINYQFGLFRQRIERGEQREVPDRWLDQGSPWLIERSDESVLVPLYGRIAHEEDRRGEYNPMWLDWELVVGVPSDIPVVGYGGHHVNRLRLFSARASSDFDVKIFNEGDYLRAVERKIESEKITKILYPEDSREAGRELRLVQEYFLVACALRDVVRRVLDVGGSLERLPEQAAIQLNDTHPALAVAELMRMLVDEHELRWERAWEITRATLSFTNHTLLPEALEKWDLPLVERVLPRHVQLIFEINRRFLDEVSARHPDDPERVGRMSVIEEGDPKQLRMVNLAVIGSHSVNGVAALHTEILRENLLHDFHELWPELIVNRTNGVTPRRFVALANPLLTRLVSEAIGDEWIGDASRLAGLEALLDDASFVERFAEVKRRNKENFAEFVQASVGERIDPAAILDVQVKRIHLYKRQLLNLMHVVHRYLSIVEDGELPAAPRTVLLSGKAAPGYWEAKEVIRLTHALADLVNNDPKAREHLRVVFLPDYRVTLAERLIPAADLSEQISTAGMEASGTGNMKLALNGALTIGTLDGANIEIRDAVGEENIFIFGHRADEVARLKDSGDYQPAEVYERDPRVRRVMDFLGGDTLGGRGGPSFSWLFPALVLERDPFFHVADLAAYLESQVRVEERFVNRTGWARMALANTARCGRFSSDRTIREYAEGTWTVAPLER